MGVGSEEKWTPIIGQSDNCPRPPLVPLHHAASGHKPLPAHTSSGVLRPDDFFPRHAELVEGDHAANRILTDGASAAGLGSLHHRGND